MGEIGVLFCAGGGSNAVEGVLGGEADFGILILAKLLEVGDGGPGVGAEGGERAGGGDPDVGVGIVKAPREDGHEGVGPGMDARERGDEHAADLRVGAGQALGHAGDVEGREIRQHAMAVALRDQG